MGISEVIITLIASITVFRLVRYYQRFLSTEHIIRDFRKSFVSLFVPQVKLIHSDFIQDLEFYQSKLLSDDPAVRENALQHLLDSAYQKQLDIEKNLNEIANNIQR